MGIVPTVEKRSILKLIRATKEMAQSPEFQAHKRLLSDASFYQSVTQGDRAHHWRFGDRPALPEVTQEEVARITAYGRWLQQQAGVR